MLQPPGAAGAEMLHVTTWLTGTDVPKGPVPVTVYVMVLVPVYAPGSLQVCNVGVGQPVQPQLVAPVQFAVRTIGTPSCAVVGPAIVHTGNPVAAHMLPAEPAVVATRVGGLVLTTLNAAMPVGQLCANAAAETKLRAAEHASAPQWIDDRFIQRLPRQACPDAAQYGCQTTAGKFRASSSNNIN